MAALDIKPHSRRISGLVIVGLSILAVGAFASGLARQANPSGASPFPLAQGSAAYDASQAVGAIPLATPAPELQVAEAAPVRHAPAKDPSADAAADPNAPSPAAATAPPAVDVSASAPEAPPAAAAPASENQPTPADPPT
jgi:hypothetical protein